MSIRYKFLIRQIPTKWNSYVEYLEEQQKLLVRALKKAYNLSIPSRSRPRGITEPSVHTMLEELDILPEFPLQHSGQDMNQFEENLEQLRKQYEAEVDVKEQARKSTVTSPQNEASDSAREDKLQTIWFSEQIEPLPNAFGNLHHVQYAQQPSLLQPESSRIPVLEWPTALKNMSGHTSSSVVRHNTPSFVLKEQRAGFPWNRHVWQSQPNATTVSPEDLILPAIPADSSRVLPDDIQWMQWINDHQA